MCEIVVLISEQVWIYPAASKDLFIFKWQFWWYGEDLCKEINKHASKTPVPNDAHKSEKYPNFFHKALSLLNFNHDLFWILCEIFTYA